jgi:Fur family transcriptional regulator, ferric uptake regulator
MKDPKDIFKEYCRENGMRCTPERDIILDEIYRKDGHFDIDELFIRLRKQYPRERISKASIYRNTPLFIKAGLLRESLNDEGRTTYEHTLGHAHHDHMKCMKCGKIIEFYDDSIDKTQEKICKKNGFRMIWHVHVINGVCLKCDSRKKTKGWK